MSENKREFYDDHLKVLTTSSVSFLYFLGSDWFHRLSRLFPQVKFQVIPLIIVVISMSVDYALFPLVKFIWATSFSELSVTSDVVFERTGLFISSRICMRILPRIPSDFHLLLSRQVSLLSGIPVPQSLSKLASTRVLFSVWRSVSIKALFWRNFSLIPR